MSEAQALRAWLFGFVLVVWACAFVKMVIPGPIYLMSWIAAVACLVTYPRRSTDTPTSRRT